MNLKYGYLLMFCKRSNPKWKKLNNKIWYTFMAFVPVPHFGTCIILPHHLIYSSITLDDVLIGHTKAIQSCYPMKNLATVRR